MSTRTVGSDTAEGSPKPGVDVPPRCFALAPLYGQLVTRQVDIKSVDANGTLGDAAVAATFTGIDVELWARRFLGDLDHFVSIFASMELDGRSELGTMLARVVDSKRAVASAIADQLKGVFDYSPCDTECDPDYRKGLQAARDALTQQLLVSLVKGYDTPAVLQYGTGVSRATAESKHQGSIPGSIDAHGHSSVPPESVQARPAAGSDTRQGTSRMPAPLRIHPPPPVLAEQMASPTFDLPIDLQQLSLWTYTLVLAHEFAAQDRALVTTEFNLTVRPPPAPCFDLFDVLAQYVSVADQLWLLLSRAQGSASIGDNAFTNAARTFADLAARVAVHWRIRSPQDKGSGEPESDYVAAKSHTFGVRIAYSPTDGTIESVSFIREPPQADSPMWPEVDVLSPDGSSVALVAQPSAPSSLAAVFVPKQGMVAPAFALQTLRLTWNGLNVSALQNVRSRVSVVRNEDLAYDPLHPENVTPATNPAFVFRTPELVAGTRVAPWIERSHPLEMKGANLPAALENAVQTLFPPDSLIANTRATWQVDYSYELNNGDASAGGSPPIMVRLPVGLYPDAPLAGVAQTLAGVAQEWMATHQPAIDGGSWMFNVVLHSGLGSEAHPLLNADLWYGIANQAGDAAHQ